MKTDQQMEPGPPTFIRLLKLALLGIGFQILTLPSLGQSLEYSKIHSEKDDAISVKLHVTEVIPMEGMSVSEIKEIVEAWYSKEVYYKKLVYRYTFSWTNGQNEWKQSRDYLPGQDSYLPFDARTENRILTAHIKCEDCFMARKTTRRKNDGYYKLDFRIKEGKLQLVFFEPYDVVEDAWLSLWLIKKDRLIDRPDPRIEAIEDQFQRVKESFVEFVLRYDEYDEPTDSEPTDSSIDDW